jgi:hypothetical protein
VMGCTYGLHIRTEYTRGIDLGVRTAYVVSVGMYVHDGLGCTYVVAVLCCVVLCLVCCFDAGWDRSGWVVCVG